MSARFSLFDARMWDSAAEISLRILATLALALLAHWLAGRLIRAFRSRIAAHIRDAEDLRRADTLARVARHGSTVVIVLVGVIVVLGTLGISLAPILGAAGVLGLALGFGAQSLVKDYVSGFFLLLENQVTKGDVVEVAGKSGEVEDVTLRYVQLRDYEGNVHFVPSGLITTVTNMSRGYAYAVIELGVAPGVDLQRVYAALRAVAVQLRADPQFAAGIEDTLEISGVERLDGMAVAVRSRLRVRPLEQWRVRREFLLRLHEQLRREGIELPTPQLLLREAPPAPKSNPAA